MNCISIADRLWFEETTLGATLNLQVSDDPDGVLFCVGISHRSLQKCDHDLGRGRSTWEIEDGSLSIEGDMEEMALTFSSQKNHLQVDVLLHGDEPKMFRYAVNALAARQRVGLN